LTATTQYSCYGLRVDSEFALPDLGRPGPDGAAPDVVVRRGALTPPDPTLLMAHGLWRVGDVCGFDIEDVGRFEARGGTEIVVDPRPGADESAIRLYVLGTAMGATMMLRGTLVLHGNSFRVGDGAAVVVGHSGSGKSTLAAEFDRRGYDVLSDDVVPVDADGRALPGYPRIKLWTDAVDRIGQDPATLERVHARVDKFHVPLRRGDLGPLPLRWVYVLESHGGPELTLEPASGAIAFALLHEHTYRNELLVGPAAGEHLQQCAALLGRTRLRRVVRPAETMTAEATADAILADIARDPASTGSPEESA
jgi:hypothetical protein